MDDKTTIENLKLGDLVNWLKIIAWEMRQSEPFRTDKGELVPQFATVHESPDRGITLVDFEAVYTTYPPDSERYTPRFTAVQLELAQQGDDLAVTMRCDDTRALQLYAYLMTAIAKYRPGAFGMGVKAVAE